MRRLWLLLTFACSSEDPVIPQTTDAGTTPEEYDHVARGRSLYRNLRCANCHGADGRGTPAFPGGPILVGRTYEDLQLTLQTECENPLELSCHPLKLPELPAQSLQDIVTYLASLANDPTQMPDPGPLCDDIPGNICTIAGNGQSGNRRGDGFMARQQYLFWPQNVVVDAQNRPVITDWNNYLIRRIESEGCQETTDVQGRTGRDCPIVNVIGTSGLGDSCSTAAAPVMAKDAVMNHPVGIWFTEEGNAVLWGWHQWKIKYIPVRNGQYGQMYCMFGNERGFSGDGMPGGFNFDGNRGPTRFNLPSSAVRDRRGNWYISDQGNLRIRIIRPDADDLPETGDPAAFVNSLRNNTIVTWAGGEPRTSTGDHLRTDTLYTNSGDGGPLWTLDEQGNRVNRVTFRVQFGFDAIPQLRMAIDNDRDLLYVADAENNRIRVIDLSQDPPVINTFAGGGDDITADGVDATQAKLYRPGDVDVFPDGSGDVLITDVFHHCVRVVDFETRIIRTVAGQCGVGTDGYEGDGGPAAASRLGEPGGAGVAPDGTIYIADTLNHRIRRVNPR